MGHLCDSVDSRLHSYPAREGRACRRHLSLHSPGPSGKKQDVGGIGAAEWLYQYLVLTCPAKFHVGKICTLPFIVQIFGEGNVKAETICDILTFLHPFIKRNIFSNPISSLSPQPARGEVRVFIEGGVSP